MFIMHDDLIKICLQTLLHSLFAVCSYKGSAGSSAEMCLQARVNMTMMVLALLTPLLQGRFFLVHTPDRPGLKTVETLHQAHKPAQRRHSGNRMVWEFFLLQIRL